MLTFEQQQTLLSFARQAIAEELSNVKAIALKDPAFLQKAGVFVSLHKNGVLRGCIGYAKAYKSIADSVYEMAKSAAFEDPRFPKLSLAELAKIDLEISILGEMNKVQDINRIRIGIDGLFLVSDYGSGLLLPQVAQEWKWDINTYFGQICRKAGISEGLVSSGKAELYSFEAQVFGEKSSF